MPAVAQLTLDGADRLHELLCTRRAPVGLTEAAACLFALRSAPSALVHQLVDEVVRADPRLVWRSAGEVALADWDEVAPLLDVAARAGRLRRLRPRDHRHPGGCLAHRRARRRPHERVQRGGADAAPCRPGVHGPRPDHRDHRHHPAPRPRAPARGARARRVPAVQHGGRARRSQRPVRHRLRRRRPGPPAKRPAGRARHRHGGPRPAADGRQARAHEPRHPRRAVRHRGAAVPPRPARRARDGRGARPPPGPRPGTGRGDRRRRDRPVRARAPAGANPARPRQGGADRPRRLPLP